MVSTDKLERFLLPGGELLTIIADRPRWHRGYCVECRRAIVWKRGPELSSAGCFDCGGRRLGRIGKGRMRHMRAVVLYESGSPPMARSVSA